MRFTVLFICATVMIDSMGVGLILPVMPALLREVEGASLAQAALWGGLLTTVFAAMQFLGGPLVGALSDRFGRRPVLLVSLFVMMLDYVVMAIAQTIWLLLLGRLIGGMAAATHSTASAAMADISSPEEKSARFGLIGAAFGVGFVLGPLMGGALAEFGTRAPFLAAAALAGLNMVLGYFALPETVTDKTKRAFEWRRANPFGAFAQVSLSPGLARLILLFFLYEVAFFAYPAVWAYYTTAQFGWSEGMIGLSLAIFGVSVAVVQGGLIRVFLRWLGEGGTVVWGLVVNLAIFLFLGLVANQTLIWFVLPLTALGGAVTPALQGIMSQATPDDAQGELQGVLTSAAALAMIVAPLTMTWVFSRFTSDSAPIYLPGAPFLVSMVLIFACLAVYLAPRRRRHTSEI